MNINNNPPVGRWASPSQNVPLQTDDISSSNIHSTPIQSTSKDIGKMFVTDYSNIPALPIRSLISDSIGVGAGEWLDQYLVYAMAITPMTPRYFHESAGLWLASIAISRRLVLRMPYGDIYPNLYIVWDALSTLYKKSTAMDIPYQIASKSFPFLLAQNDSTPEALLSDMAGKEPSTYVNMTTDEKAAWEKERDYSAQRGMLLDELSGLLAAMGRDYNAGLLETFLRLYDCTPSFTRSTRNQGRIHIRNSYLSILGASTPVALSPYLKSEKLWNNGFWPRFAILTVEDRPAWVEAKYVDIPASLSQHLQNLFSNLPPSKWPDFPQPLSVGLGRGVMDVWNVYNKVMSYDLLTPDLDSKLYAAYGRFPTHVLKVATILAALDWEHGGAPIIELPHLSRAIQIIESWRESVHRAIVSIDKNNYEQICLRITNQLSKDGSAGTTFRDICRGMRDVTPQEITKALEGLIFSGDIIQVPKKSGIKGGRSTEIYKIA
jgi:hypothetical protein